MTAGEQFHAMLERMARFREAQIPWPMETHAYSSMEDYVAREGRPFDARPKPKRYRWRAEQMCYFNGFYLVMASKGRLRYVEGFGCTTTMPIPLLHAWAIDAEDQVIDVTWRHPHAYVGVVFDTDDVMRAHAERGGEYVHMIDDWERGWPLLRRKEHDDAAA